MLFLLKVQDLFDYVAESGFVSVLLGRRVLFLQHFSCEFDTCDQAEADEGEDYCTEDLGIDH